MNKKLLVLVGALVVAAMGTFMLVKFVSGAEERAVAESGENRVVVALAQSSIPAGTPIGEIIAQGLVQDTEVPELALVPGAFAVSDLQARETMVLAVDLAQNDQLFEARLIAPEDLAAANDELPFVGRTRTVEAPEDLLEVTIPVSSAGTLGGELLPGDSVAIVASFGELTLVSNGSAVAIGEDGEIVPVPATLEGDEETIVPDRSGIIARQILVTEVRQAGAQSQAVAVSVGDSETSEDEGPVLAQSLVPLEGTVFVTLAAPAGTIERIVFAAEYGRIWLAADPDTTSEGGTGVQSYQSVYVDTNPVGAGG